MSAENPFVELDPSSPAARKAIAARTPGVARAARWFWWIAALSLVNSVLVHSGSDRNFIVGLGFTLLADVGLRAILPLALILDALALGFFFAMGWYAQRGYIWAFVVGGIMYALDGLIYLLFQDFMPVAFHGWALFCIFQGGKQLHQALKVARSGHQFPPELPAGTMPPLPSDSTPATASVAQSDPPLAT